MKGLAEREVEADLQAEIDADRSIVNEFLQDAGFDEGEISYAAPKIFDTRTEQRFRNGNEPEDRYIANTTVTVRSTDVTLVQSSMEEAVNLVGRGVIITAENWQTPTEFLYTSLNDTTRALSRGAPSGAVWSPGNIRCAGWLR